jgi:hypothetical protein
MDIKKVTKMFRGRVDIRSYEVGVYIKKGGVKIEHDGQYMILSPDQLKKGEVMTKNLKSKFSNQTYDLHSYIWKPINENQGQLI